MRSLDPKPKKGVSPNSGATPARMGGAPIGILLQPRFFSFTVMRKSAPLWHAKPSTYREESMQCHRCAVVRLSALVPLILDRWLLIRLGR